jgi:hypothetical protein
MAMERISLSASGLVIEAEDTMVHYGRPSRFQYRIAVLGGNGSEQQRFALRDAPAIVIDPGLLEGRDYLVVHWTAVGEDQVTLPPSEAHYARSSTGWELVGVLRGGQ